MVHRHDPAIDPQPDGTETTRVRQGRTLGVMRYVLTIGIALALIMFVLVYLGVFGG